MFKFLKKKLKDAVSSLSQKVEEEGKQEEVEVTEEVQPKEAEVVERKEPEIEHLDEEEPEVEDKPDSTKEETTEEKPKVEEPEPVKEEEPVVETPKIEDITPIEPEEKSEDIVVEEPTPVEIEEPKEIISEPEPVKEEPKVEEKKDEISETLQEEESKVEQLEKGAELLKEEEEQAIPQEETKKKKGFFKRIFSKKEDEEPSSDVLVETEVRPEDEPKEELIEEVKEKVTPKPQKVEESKPETESEEKGGFFSRISKKIKTTSINQTQFDEMFWDLELALLENNVAVEVIEKLKVDLAKELVDQPLKRGGVEASILGALKNSIESLFIASPIDLIETVKQASEPVSFCFVGINGAGKTTTIAKVAQLFKDHGHSVVIAACDTFRAAAIDQLQSHADKLGVKMIKHDYGADPAAVAYDAIAHAKKENIDVVLIDTAGRLHSNVNLMDELHKIIRVAKPDLNIFIGEAVTGNDCVEQAKKFNETVGIDGIILSKADVDEKGGASISVSYVTGKPILYLGVGQEYKDLQKFNKDKLMESLGI